MNEPYTKEAYEAKLKVLELNKYSKFLNCKSYFVELAKKSPHRASRNLNVENSSGNYLINCKNAYDCFDSFELQDCAYSTWIFTSHDCYDVYGMGHGEFVLEGLGVEALNNCAFNTFVSDSSDAFYSDCCFYSMNIFGCASLRNKKYCILNKQYSPDDYEVMKKKIIEHMKKTGEWGEFFPVSLSPFAYNETAANYRFTLTKEKALGMGRGYRWREPDPKEYKKQTYVLPDDLKGVEVGVCDQILACTDCRFLERFGSRNPRHLWERKCTKCSKSMMTSYSPERPEKVYCEECYATIVN